MSSLSVALIVFCCCFGAAVVGTVLHRIVPDDHLDSESKDVVKLVMGLIATMSALVLGLLIASAKSSFDTQQSDLRELSTDLIQVDHQLAEYGPEANGTRDMLRQAIAFAHDQVWSSRDIKTEDMDPAKFEQQTNALYDSVRNLSPKTDAQRAELAAALQFGSHIARTRIMMFEQSGGQIAWPFLAVLIMWVATLFLGFGLLARFNATTVLALLIGALCVSGAIFLILELNEPYRGLLQISDAPLRYALSRLGH